MQKLCCTCVHGLMWLESACIVGTRSHVIAYKLYASHLQHTELNQLNQMNVCCSMVVEHAQKTHQPCSIEHSISTPSIRWLFHPFNIRSCNDRFYGLNFWHAVCNWMLCFEHKTCCKMWNCVKCYHKLLNILPFDFIFKFFEACKNDAKWQGPRNRFLSMPKWRFHNYNE
jgi:hypothetical protein